MEKLGDWFSYDKTPRQQKTLQTISIKPCNFQQHSWQKCQQYHYHHFLHRALIFARDAPGVEDMDGMIRLMRWHTIFVYVYFPGQWIKHWLKKEHLSLVSVIYDLMLMSIMWIMWTLQRFFFSFWTHFPGTTTTPRTHFLLATAHRLTGNFSDYEIKICKHQKCWKSKM